MEKRPAIRAGSTANINTFFHIIIINLLSLFLSMYKRYSKTNQKNVSSLISNSPNIPLPLFKIKNISEQMLQLGGLSEPLICADGADCTDFEGGVMENAGRHKTPQRGRRLLRVEIRGRHASSPANRDQKHATLAALAGAYIPTERLTGSLCTKC